MSYDPDRLVAALEDNRMPIIIGMSVLGGLGIGRAAFEGISQAAPGENRRLVLTGAAIGLAFGVFYLFDLDRRWLLLDDAAKAAEQELAQRWP